MSKLWRWLCPHTETDLSGSAALEESQRRLSEDDKLVSRAVKVERELRRSREENHYAQAIHELYGRNHHD